MATVIGLKRWASMKSSSKNPKNAAGRKPTIIFAISLIVSRSLYLNFSLKVKLSYFSSPITGASFPLAMGLMS